MVCLLAIFRFSRDENTQVYLTFIPQPEDVIYCVKGYLSSVLSASLVGIAFSIQPLESRQLLPMNLTDVRKKTYSASLLSVKEDRPTGRLNEKNCLQFLL